MNLYTVVQISLGGAPRLPSAAENCDVSRRINVRERDYRAGFLVKMQANHSLCTYHLLTCTPWVNLVSVTAGRLVTVWMV